MIETPLLWVMDWNLQTSPSGIAEASNIDFGDLSYVKIAEADGVRAESGTYQSPAYDWTVPARLQQLVVAADLNHGRATATVQTSDDGFRSLRSQLEIILRDGVNTYPLDGLEGQARAVRVRLDLARGPEDASPLVDGFRITGKPAAQASRE